MAILNSFLFLCSAAFVCLPVSSSSPHIDDSQEKSNLKMSNLITKYLRLHFQTRILISIFLQKLFII